MNYPHDEIPTITERKMVYQTQHRPDHIKLELICPKDQTVFYRAQWDETTSALVLTQVTPEVIASHTERPAAEKAMEAEVLRMKQLKSGDLKTIAAERGVEWDKSASRDTMIELIARAGLPKEPLVVEQASA